MIGQWLTQIGLVIRLEMRKTFFSRRGLWVYLLALAPVLIFLGHSLSEISNRKERQEVNAAHPVSTEALESIQTGMTLDEVVEKVGEPYVKTGFHRPNISIDIYQYTDGESVFGFQFRNSELMGISVQDRDTIPKDSLIFAAVFQFFYLRLAIFFGCVGVFMNLFRGEMLDKSLHFYLLAPIRREILAIGKYLAGLIATVVIFCTSTSLQLPRCHCISQAPKFPITWRAAAGDTSRRTWASPRLPAWDTAASFWPPDCCSAIPSFPRPPSWFGKA